MQQALAAFHVAARDRITRIPGAVAATTVSGNTAIPLNGPALGGSSRTKFAAAAQHAPTVDPGFASPHYFESLQIPLIQGRSLDEHGVCER